MNLFGKKNRLGALLIAAGSFVSAAGLASSANADSFTLVGTLHGGSSATVTLSGAVSGSGYADILLWKDTTSPASTPLTTNSLFETYCIDVTHDISVPGPYTLTVGTIDSATSNPPYTTNEISAVKYLFGTYQHGLQPVTSNIGNNPGDAGTTNARTDANFQAALWAVLNDYSQLSTAGSAPANLNNFSGSPHLNIANVPSLNGTDNGNGFVSAAAMAWQAVQDAAGTIHKNGSDQQNANLDAMYLVNKDTGQEQVFLTTANIVKSPLPSSMVGGIGLFGLIALASRARRAKNSTGL